MRAFETSTIPDIVVPVVVFCALIYIAIVGHLAETPGGAGKIGEAIGRLIIPSTLGTLFYRLDKRRARMNYLKRIPLDG